MPGGNSAQREGDTPTATLKTFEFKSIEDVSMLEYQRPSSNQGRSVAIAFFGGEEASRNASATEPSTTDGSIAPKDEENVNDYEQDDSQSIFGWPHPRRGSALDWDFENRLVPILKRKLDMVNRQLTKANEKLQRANNKLVSAEQRLGMIHKQSMHSAQELAEAVRPQGYYQPPRTDQGLFPFLVHCSSTPLIKKRITFTEKFDLAPKIIVGIQTGDPSAMALVCAMDVDEKGFTVHADLTNHSDFAGKAELMKCLVSWMAFETIQRPDTALDGCERPSKRGKI